MGVAQIGPVWQVGNNRQTAWTDETRRAAPCSRNWCEEAGWHHGVSTRWATMFAQPMALTPMQLPFYVRVGNLDTQPYGREI